MKKQWLTTCAWEDEAGALHIDVPRMLTEMGIPDTPGARDAMTREAARILAELLKDRPAVIKITK